MLHRRWMKILLLAAVTVWPVSAIQAADGIFSGNKKELGWQEALEKANRKVANEGAASVLGVRIGTYVHRINTQTKEHKKMQQFYGDLQQHNTSKEFIRKCQANFDLIRKSAQANPLFARYELSAIVPGDFCMLSAQEMTDIRHFFQGTKPAYQAYQYSDALLLNIKSERALLWFAVDPKDQMIFFNYNDPKDLEELEILKTNWQPLPVSR